MPQGIIGVSLALMLFGAVNVLSSSFMLGEDMAKDSVFREKARGRC
jgi:hypothetical protein